MKRLVIFNSLFLAKIFRVNRIIKFSENLTDLIKLKLSEREFIRIRQWILKIINLSKILYVMLLIVGIMTAVWMHESMDV